MKSTTRLAIEALQKAAAEIVTSGHNGWGNVCLDAAALLQEHDARIKVLEDACQLFVDYETAADSDDGMAMMLAYNAAHDAIRAALNQSPKEQSK